MLRLRCADTASGKLWQHDIVSTPLDLTSLHPIPRRLEHGWTIWTVSNPNELTAVAGHLRYKAKHGFALYRGESSLHSSMLATGFRPPRDGSNHRSLSQRQYDNYTMELRRFIDTVYGAPCTCTRGPLPYRDSHLCEEQAKHVKGSSSAVVSGTYRAVIEPLLQHYGVKTRWLDVVDNIWVALWFACFKQVTVGRYAHHVRRSPTSEGLGARAYIVIFQTEQLIDTGVPGYRVGPRTRMVDLRYNVPSVYLRPHAQHGSLIARARTGGDPLGGLDDSVAGVIEVDLADALTWLGDGSMSSAGTLFPSASFDEGYRRLLDYAPAPDSRLGNLTVYGPLV